jgi:hypothetical protein
VVDPGHCRVEDRNGCDDGPKRAPHVYWRITRLLVRDGQQAAVRREIETNRRLHVPGIESLTLAYFFYYEQDEGVNPHYNDVEGVQMQIDFEAENPAASPIRRRAVVARVTGLGHGSELMSNILQVKKSIRHSSGAPDVTLPITILVEEGKHASAPDRNGDGTYTPGYDVNVKVNDAWGVRDVFGSGVVASRYRESMTKPRTPDGRVGPSKTWFEPPSPVPAPAECYATPAGLGLPGQSYDLLPAPECPRERHLPFCVAVATLAKKDRGSFYRAACLGGPVTQIQAGQAGTGKPKDCGYLNMAQSSEQFSRDRQINAFPMRYQYGEWWPLQPFRYLGLAARQEGGAYGPQLTWFSPFGFPKFGGWLAARGAFVKDEGEWHWRVDVSHTPSLSRIADWYAAVGYDWGVTSGEEGPPEQRLRHDGWAAEAGVQVRFRALWLRTGARGSLIHGRLSNFRLVAELGFGPQPKDAQVH